MEIFWVSTGNVLRTIIIGQMGTKRGISSIKYWNKAQNKMNKDILQWIKC